MGSMADHADSSGSRVLLPIRSLRAGSFDLTLMDRFLPSGSDSLVRLCSLQGKGVDSRIVLWSVAARKVLWRMGGNSIQWLDHGTEA